MRKIKIQIQLSGAPYPSECWWRICGSNGRILVSSELMGKKNAVKVIKNVINAIKGNHFIVETKKPGSQAILSK